MGQCEGQQPGLLAWGGSGSDPINTINTVLRITDLGKVKLKNELDDA
jgi:hypothetical protein